MPDEQAHQTQLGDILFKALDQLKGTGLKAAQLLSLNLGVLPAGLRERLAQGHHQVTPALNRAHVIQLLRQELGGAPHERFAEFELQAFAAASLGQVHRARSFDGGCLAVKLQYPGMAAAARSEAAWAAHAAGQSKDLFKADQTMGLLHPDLGLAPFSTELLPALQPLLDWQILPWRKPVFDFAKYRLPPSLQAAGAARREVTTRHLHRIPPEMPSFDRSRIGLTELLRRLGTRVRTNPPWSVAP